VFERKSVIIIGSGMGSLSAACILAKNGFKVTILEQNYQPGGCTSSYKRKDFVFEAGATTLVGLDDGMPLKCLIDKLGIELQGIKKLSTPMNVYLPNGEKIIRHQDLNKWIEEAENAFGKEKQKEFWTECFNTSKKVWNSSMKFKHFPPEKLCDLVSLAFQTELKDLSMVPKAFISIESKLKKYSLDRNSEFVKFINEQLMITAQNTSNEVNELFGSTALCYTNFGNYYMDGGLLNLVNQLISYIESHGGAIIFREKVQKIEKQEAGYKLTSNKTEHESEFIISGIPLENTMELMDLPKKVTSKIVSNEKLSSAFQWNIALNRKLETDALHHQFILEKPFVETESNSFFVSLSHPEDKVRTAIGTIVSITTHVANPEMRQELDKESLKNQILDRIEKSNLFRREEIVYEHASEPKDWLKWTGRKYGFVGGYPQLMNIKPWQMVGSRLDGYKAYQCGDTVYPGQGIPGVTLGGIIAAEKLISDW
jgi:C-3',4' desaturase CrtD